MSERRERSFLRRARDPHEPVEGEPSGESETVADPPNSPLGGAEPSGFRRGAELRRSMAIAAERVDEIISTAHQMAEQIRREAEAEADRLVEIRRREADLLAQERLASARSALGKLRAEIDQIEERHPRGVARRDPVRSGPCRGTHRAGLVPPWPAGGADVGLPRSRRRARPPRGRPVALERPARGGADPGEPACGPGRDPGANRDRPPRRLRDRPTRRDRRRDPPSS